MAKRHVVIVGAGPGIGLGAARAFGGAGFALSLLARRAEALAEATRGLLAQGISAASYVADAANEKSLTHAVGSAIAHFGAVDVLVYNAVSFSQGRPSAADPATLTRDFTVNVAGALAAAQAVLPGMRQRNCGTLLFTGGGWALHPDPAFASMAVSKGALRTLVQLLAKELDGSGLRASTLTVMGTVQPGSAFDPDAIGRAFLELHQRPKGELPAEVQFKGAA